MGVSRPAILEIDARGIRGATIGSSASRAKSDCITTTKGYARRAAAIGFSNTSNCVIVTRVVLTNEIDKAAVPLGVTLNRRQILTKFGC